MDQSSGYPCKTTIVHLSDLRKEYALIAAKIKLLKEIPAHILSGMSVGVAEHPLILFFVFLSADFWICSVYIAALKLTPEETIIMLVRTGCVDTATSLAVQYGLELDVVFDYLVDKYLSAVAQEQE